MFFGISLSKPRIQTVTPGDAASVFSAPDPVVAIEAMLEHRGEEQKRRQWLNNRFWHNGPHAQCCKKCFQAGYVVALVHAERLDLLGEHPELIAVAKEMMANGLLQTAARK